MPNVVLPPFLIQSYSFSGVAAELKVLPALFPHDLFEFFL